jgi:hypothetical protein
MEMRIDDVIVTNPDFTAEAPSTLSFADSTGKTWTINGTAEIIQADTGPWDQTDGNWTLGSAIPKNPPQR